MITPMSLAGQSEFDRLRELTARVGKDPLLTQASTGNSSIKVGEELWIKASGRWMAAAERENIFVRLSLPLLKGHLRQGMNPAQDFREASLETAMHATIPHTVVIHLHSVDAIAWAVRADGPSQLQKRLSGLRWQWLPYLASGLPLACGIEEALRTRPDTELFVLANHGIVIEAPSVAALESLLAEVQSRLKIPRRFSHPADYSVLSDISEHSRWDIPEDDDIHGLGTDPIARKIVSEGILYPCQAIFSRNRGLDAFQPVPHGSYRNGCYMKACDQPFLILEGCGVLVSRDISPAGIAMLSGLAQVVQRISASDPIRYLQDADIAALSPEAVHRYCELANRSWTRGEEGRRAAAR
jgi:rhamnose utilization protein RhaD (predicted bifunctional aldolase and dehydrogenase)